jgi:hypothetical protein
MIYENLRSNCDSKSEKIGKILTDAVVGSNDHNWIKQKINFHRPTHVSNFLEKGSNEFIKK